MGQELQIGQDPSEAGEAAPRIEFHDSLKLRRARVVGNAQIVGTVFKFVGNKIADAMSKELKEHAPTGRAMPTIIDMQALKVGGELRLSQRTSFDGRVNLTFAHIAGNLDLTEGASRGIDLTGATIDSEIRLGSPQHPAPNWAPPENVDPAQRIGGRASRICRAPKHGQRSWISKDSPMAGSAAAKRQAAS